MKRFLGKATVACCLTAAIIGNVEAQSDQKAKGSFLRELAGAGGQVSLITAPHPDGTEEGFTIGTDPQSGEQIFKADGSITLETPELFLQCLHLEFLGAESRLSAEKNITLRTEGIEATSQQMKYDMESGGVVLTGSPHVVQNSPENIVTFDGMDEFEVAQADEGKRAVQLRGSTPITVDMKPVNTTPENAEENGTGVFGGMGKTMNIVTSPRGNVRPQVNSTMAASGDLEIFHSVGSVVLKSSKFNIRADEIIFRNAAQTFEALGNVFLRQDSIEADCGRMLYDLKTGKVTLSIKPDVRRFEEGGMTKFIKYETLVITPQKGTSPDVQGIGPGQILYMPMTEQPTSPTTPSKPTGAIEIDMSRR